MLKLTFFLFISLAHIYAECVFPGLNISNLDGLTLECRFAISPDDYVVSYTPCNNQIRCPTIGAPLSMVIQENEGIDFDCYDLAFWDPDVMPVLNETANPIEYTFSYKNGGSTFGCPNGRNIDITYICDPTANPYGDIQCGEENEPCNYYYKIKTIDACNVAPSGQCIWNSGGKVLNLTLFAENNIVLSEIDASDSNNVIALTPCRNGLECTPENIKKLAYKYTDSYIPNNKEGNVMGFLAEIDDLKCLQTLATWNAGSVEPSYDAQNQIWQFLYEIPNGCDGLTSVFAVYYTCNPNAFYIIESALTVTKCLYQMTIQTYLACDV